MIKSVSINNFRCFSKVSVEGLGRINVLLGANGSGKTALLEAIFLACGGSPELGLRLRNFRGMGNSVEVRSDGLEALWKNLFNNFDQRKSIDIDLKASDMQSRSLRISKGDSEELRLPLRSSGTARTSVTAPIEFAWKDAAGSIFRSRPVISGDKLSFQQSKPSATRVVFIPANFRLRPEETAQRFSTLSRKNAISDLMDVLRTVYPDIESISVENADGSWEVFVQVKFLDERIPMGLHSSGASRLVAIMLAITAAERGVILIDEIENSFYFRTLPEIWRVIATLADEFKCQVFASTHSQECLNALAGASDIDPKSLCLLNLERTDGVSRVSVSPGEVMISGIRSGFDLR